MLPGNLSMCPRIPVSLSGLLQTLRLKLRMLSAILLLGSLPIPALCQTASRAELPRAARNLPLSFEENRGQAGEASRYLLRHDSSEALFSTNCV